MRSQSELRIISAQLDFLDERKTETEAEINSVISRCKSWMEEKEENKTSLSELLVLCAKIADKYQEDSNCPKQQIPKEKSNCSSEHTVPSINTEDNDFQKKIMSKLEVMEMAVSSLNTSNKLHEKNVDDIKNTFDTFSESMIEKLTLIQNEQSEQSTIINNSLKTENEKVQSLEISLKKIEEKFQEQYEELVHDVSSCNDTVKLLESNYSDMSCEVEMLYSKCKNVDNEVSSLKSIIQTLAKSQNGLQESVEFLKQEQITQKEQLQTKVQTLQEQSHSSAVLLLKHQNTLRDVLQSYVKKQEGNAKTIEHLEYEIQKRASLKPQIGYLASHSNIEIIIESWSSAAKNVTSTKLDEMHEKNSKCILKCFQNIVYNSEGDFDPKSGIFKARYDGLYLIYADIFGLQTSKYIHLGFVMRENNKIAIIGKYKNAQILEGKAHFVHILYLKCGQEICILPEKIENKTSGHFACILLM